MTGMERYDAAPGEVEQMMAEQAVCPRCDSPGTHGIDGCDECGWTPPETSVSKTPQPQGYYVWTCDVCGSGLGTSRTRPSPCETCIENSAKSE